jgi:hypothetical protein
MGRAMILDLLQRLAEQQRAITEAQVALHKLVELGLDAQDVLQGFPGTPTPAETASPVLGLPAAPQSAICAAPGCTTPLPVQTTRGRQRRYCSAACRTAAAVARAAANRRQAHLARKAAADRARTVAILEQNNAEGYAGKRAPY